VRSFEDRLAVRERVPLLIGLIGPSGGGKTFSAHRLAAGIQRVTGGDIYMIDTEARRGLHYADRFKFRHLEFRAPFGSLDYLAAINHCARKGAGVIIIDSQSHEHAGDGGHLDQHEAEVARMLSAWKNSTRDSVQMPAWAKPKADRQRLINTILQTPCNFIFCFRAKEKVKLSTKEEKAGGEKAVQQLGWMPIAGEEFVFEMTVNGLLLPGAGGVPTWIGAEAGEKRMIKLPEQFRKLLLEHKGPLDEQLGETMATWAAGDVAVAVPTGDELDQVLVAFARAASVEEVERVAADNRGKRWSKEHTHRIRVAKIERTESLAPKGAS